MAFTITKENRPIKNGIEIIQKLAYKGEVIAIFGPDSKETPEDYIKTRGYMAEHRRRWNNGDYCNWSEDIRVQV